MPNYRIPSQSQINSRVRQVQREMETKVRIRTNNGKRALTKSEIQQLGRDAARRLKF